MAPKRARRPATECHTATVETIRQQRHTVAQTLKKLRTELKKDLRIVYALQSQK